MWEGKKVQNSARFRTTFDFARAYLWNGGSYRQEKKALSSTLPDNHNRRNLVNFGQLRMTVSAHMLTHPKSTMRVVCVLCMLTYLSSGRVTLLRGKFQPPKLFHASDLRRRAASRWALLHISSYYYFHLHLFFPVPRLSFNI